MTGRKLSGILAAISIVMVISACAVKQSDRIIINGTEYGVTEGNFGSDWFDYYERGASYIGGALVAMDAGDQVTMTKAVQLGMDDLRKALKLRDKDQRRARTYGQHLIDYFPHREMGIGYYIIGDYENAVMELDASLATVESNKAQFFLDKARQKAIDNEGGDATDPEVKVSGFPERTREAEITLKIHASDDGYVSSLMVNLEEENIPSAKKVIEVERKVILMEGENIIEVVAIDLAGNTAVKSITVISDTSGPSVTIDESVVQTGANAGVRIKGWVSDPSGVKSIKLGDLDLVPGADGSFGGLVRPDSNGMVPFEAVDSLGNKTPGKIDPKEEIVEQGRKYDSTLAGLINRYNVMGPLTARWVVESARAAKRRGPVIKVKGLTSKQIVYFKSFYLEGVAYDPSGVTRLRVGRKNLIKKPGRKVYFNYLRRLRAGTNRITIVGKNGLGEAAQKRVTVIRKVPVVRQVGSRMRMSMLPFYKKGRVDKGEVAYDDLLKYMKRSGRFRMIDRTQIDSVVRELNMSKKGLTNQKSAVRAGKMVAAEVVLLGYVYETPGAIEVYGRVVDVESGVILTEKDAYTRNKPITLKKLMSLMRGLSIRLRNQFPLVEGRVALLKGTNLQAKLKSRAPLKKGTKLIVFREKAIIHKQTKMHLGNQTIPIAEARISRSRKGSASAVLVNRKDARKIRKTDKVITK